MIILAIFTNALKRLSRSKLLIVSVVASVLILALTSSSLIALNLARAAGNAEEVRQASVVLFIGVLSMMGFFASLVALFNGVTVTQQEIRDGTIFSVLSKPVTRAEYLLGSYFASVVYLLFVWAIFAAVCIGTMLLARQHLEKLHGIIILGRIALSVMMLSIAFCLAQRFGPWIAGVLAVFAYNGATFVSAALGIARLLKLSCPPWLAQTLAWPFPATASLDRLAASFLSSPLNAPQVGWTFLHLIDYSAVMVVIAWLLFRRMELCQPGE